MGQLVAGDMEKNAQPQKVSSGEFMKILHWLMLFGAGSPRKISFI